MYTNKQVNRYFEIAKDASKLSDCKQKIGALLVYKNKILKVGHNKKISSPIQKRYNVYRTDEKRTYDIERQHNYIHAEIDCLSDLKLFNYRFDKCSIFIYRETKDGQISVAKPCKACERYLKDMNIRNIYYTVNNGWNYERRNYNE